MLVVEDNGSEESKNDGQERPRHTILDINDPEVQR